MVLQSLSTVAPTLLAVISIFSLKQKCTISNITAHNMDFEASWLLLRKPKQSVELDACETSYSEQFKPSDIARIEASLNVCLSKRVRHAP